MKLDKRFLKFAAVGVITTIVQVVLYTLARLWLGSLSSTVFSLLTVTVLGTELNRLFTFKATAKGAAADQILGMVLMAGTATVEWVAGIACVNAGVTGVVESILVIGAGCLFGAVRFLVLKVTMGARQNASNCRNKAAVVYARVA